MNNKGRTETITSHLDRTPSEWVDVIRATIPEPHLQAWCAGILAWDYDDTEASAILWPMASGYSYAEAPKMLAADIIGALEKIGYRQARVRCSCKQDEFATGYVPKVEAVA